MAVTGYEVRIDGGDPVNVGLPSIVSGYRQYDATGFDPETNHTFEVRAYDGAGNRSTWTPAVNATTLEAFSPLALVGLYQWLDIEELALSDNDPIASATDQSGNARHATQAESTDRPLYKAGIANGRAVARFDGTDDFLDLDDETSFLTAAEVFIVLKIDTDPPTSPQQGLWGFTATWPPAQFPNVTGNIEETFGFSGAARDLGNPATSLATGFHIYHGFTAPNSWRFGLDGTWLTDEVTTNTVNFYANAVLGTDVGIPGTIFLDGDVAEFILCSSKQTDTNRNECIAYLKAKYDIA